MGRRATQLPHRWTIYPSTAYDADAYDARDDHDDYDDGAYSDGGDGFAA